MKQKILNLFLIVLMIFIFSPIISYANTSKPDGAKWLVDEGTNHVWYEITGNTLTIGGYGAMTEWNDTNYSTQPWRNNNIIDVVIENGITSIGAYSFYKILSITEVNFPTTLTSIGKYAFYENNIENLVLPEGLITISEYAFYHNENLITIVLPSTLKSIGDAGLRRNITETIISYNTNPPELGQNVFNSAGAAPTYLKKVIIPYNSETDYKNNSGWSKVLDEQLHGKEIPIFETYVIKTNITGEGSIIPSINNVLVSEYDSQKVNLTINYSSDYLLKSLEVLDADGNKISINNNSFTMPDNNVTINAIFAKKVNVNFNTNGGSTIDSQVIASGDKIIKPTNPTKSGFSFDGWYQDITLKTLFDFDVPVTKEVTLYAKWTISKYKVSFDKNGGTGLMSDATGLLGLYTLPSNEFIAPNGKQFKGWSLSSNGEIITELDVKEDKTVYAIWENIPKDYSYKFEKGDNQELTINAIDSFTFTIDGDYSLFDSLKIGNLNLIIDEDYIVTEGSTIITFTNKGIAKLNTLKEGKYDILVTYSNGKNVIGSLNLNKTLPQAPNTSTPKTGDNINYYIIVGIISLLGLIGTVFYGRKKLY